MEQIDRQFIDWTKTGRNLEMLRNDNLNLRRASCRARFFGGDRCDNIENPDCNACKYGLDNSISRRELAELFGVSEDVIYNWEKGTTPVGLEDLLFYCKIAKVELFDVVAFMERKTK